MNRRLRALIVTTSTCLVTLLVVGVVLGSGPSTGDSSAYNHLKVFTEVLARIKSDYVEEPDMKSVTLGALNGLLESIDPFASYLNADQYKEYLRNHDAYKGSVGLILSKRFGYVGVVDAIPGSPAEKAGLTTGDIIESIKGVATRDMPLAYAYVLLQGKPGTPVDVSVLAMRHPEPKKITLTRAAVQPPAVASKMLPGEVGYVHVESLNHEQTREVATALSTLRKQGAKKLVLDLRHSASGTPEEGIALANLFLDKGLITYLEGQKSARKDFAAEPAKAVWNQPVVVITNRGTASGAEVAAAALLDNKRAEVVGERTYGDAALRQAISMDDGGAIILSVAKYYSPSGKSIQDQGVTPSVQVSEAEPAVELDEEGEPAEEQPQQAPQKSAGEDQLLKKALEVLDHGVEVRAANPAEQGQDAPNVTGAPSRPLNIPAPQK